MGFSQESVCCRDTLFCEISYGALRTATIRSSKTCDTHERVPRILDKNGWCQKNPHLCRFKLSVQFVYVGGDQCYFSIILYLAVIWHYGVYLQLECGEKWNNAVLLLPWLFWIARRERERGTFVFFSRFLSPKHTFRSTRADICLITSDQWSSLTSPRISLFVVLFDS